MTAAVAAVAAFEVEVPFSALVHTWWFSLAVTTAGAYLLWTGLSAAISRKGNVPLALAALGGGLLAGTVAFAAFLVGAPLRVPAAPGQTYRPPHSAGVALVFPDVSVGRENPNGENGNAAWPDHIDVIDGTTRTPGRAGDTVRAGAFVFSIASGPIAHVDARSIKGDPETVTQPDGAAFLSPFLTFGGLDGDKPEDYFAVPALHRTVQVDYWPGLPSRGIDVPFLALRISEENGGPLYEGVAVSSRPLRKAGVELTFLIGAYPVVSASSAPPLLPFWSGIAMIAAGWIGAALRPLRRTA